MPEVKLFHYEFICDSCGFKMGIESPEKDDKKINQEDEGIPAKCFRKGCKGNISLRVLSSEEARLENLRKANSDASAEAYKVAAQMEQANPTIMVSVQDAEGLGQPQEVPKSVIDNLERKVKPSIDALDQE